MSGPSAAVTSGLPGRPHADNLSVTGGQGGRLGRLRETTGQCVPRLDDRTKTLPVTGKVVEPVGGFVVVGHERGIPVTQLGVLSGQCLVAVGDRGQPLLQVHDLLGGDFEVCPVIMVRGRSFEISGHRGQPVTGGHERVDAVDDRPLGVAFAFAVLDRLPPHLRPGGLDPLPRGRES